MKNLVLFFIFCIISLSNGEQNLIGIFENNTSSYNSDKQEAYILHQDSIFNHLFSIKYTYKWNNFRDRRIYTLITNHMDTSYQYNFPLRTNRRSMDVQNHLSKIGQLNKQRISRDLRLGYFYLKEVLQIDDHKYLGIFVDYCGHESIPYAYGQLILKDNYYILTKFYKRMDSAGIGSISYEKPVNLGNNGFYLVGHKFCEGYESLTLNYFLNDEINETYILEECFPSDDDDPHTEKLEYCYIPEKHFIYIKKFEKNLNNNDPWNLLNQTKYNLIQLIENIKKSL